MTVVVPETTAFIAPELDKVYRGKIELRAPTLGDIIQVNAGEVDGETMLRVRRDKSGVHVARIDGNPIQVQVNEDVVDPSSSNSVRHKVTTVFEERIDSVSFCKRVIKERREVFANASFDTDKHATEIWEYNWIGWVAVGNNVKATDQRAMQKFANELGAFVYPKQESVYIIPRLKKKARFFFLKHGLIDPFD